MSATMTAPARERKARSPRRKPVRTVVIRCQPEADYHGLLTIYQDGQPTAYWWKEIESQLGGRGFELRKFRAEEPYHVLLNGQASTCDCPGFEGWHHRHPCKHVSALLALETAGRLPRPVQAPEPAVDDRFAADAI